MTELDQSQLRELRDILIELKTEFKDFREYSREKFELFKSSKQATDDLHTRLTLVESHCADFVRIKKKVTGTMWGLVVQVIAVIVALILLLKDKVI